MVKPSSVIKWAFTGFGLLIVFLITCWVIGAFFYKALVVYAIENNVPGLKAFADFCYIIATGKAPPKITEIVNQNEETICTCTYVCKVSCKGLECKILKCEKISCEC